MMALVVSAAACSSLMSGVDKASFNEAFECMKAVPKACNVDFASDTWGCKGPIVSARCVVQLQCLGDQAARCAPKWRSLLVDASASMKLPERRQCVEDALRRRRGARAGEKFCGSTGPCADDVRAAVAAAEECLGYRMPSMVGEATGAGVAVYAVNEYLRCADKVEWYQCGWGSFTDYCSRPRYSTAECLAKSEVVPALIRALPSPYRASGLAAYDCAKNDFCGGSVTECLTQARCVLQNVNAGLGFDLVPMAWVPSSETELKSRYLTPGSDVVDCFKAIDVSLPQCNGDVAATWAGCTRELNAVLKQADACQKKAADIVETNMPELPYQTFSLPRMPAGDAAAVAAKLGGCGAPALCAGDAAGCAAGVKCANGVLRSELSLDVPALGQVDAERAGALQACLSPKNLAWGACGSLAAGPNAAKENECAGEVNALLKAVADCSRSAGLPAASLMDLSAESLAAWRAEVDGCSDSSDSQGSAGGPPSDASSSVSWSGDVEINPLEVVACAARATAKLGGSLGRVADAVARTADLLPCLQAVKAPATASDTDRFVADAAVCVAKLPLRVLTLDEAQEARVSSAVAAKCAAGRLCAGATVSGCLEQLECAAREWQTVAGKESWQAPAAARFLRTMWDTAKSGNATWACMERGGAVDTAQACNLQGSSSADFGKCLRALDALTSLAQQCGEQEGLAGSGKVVDASLLPELNRVVSTAEAERQKCLPNGREPCTGDAPACLADMQCLMRGANKALGRAVLPAEAMSPKLLREYIDCGETIGSQCGTLESSEDDMAVTMAITCGSRVMLECTASEETAAESVRLTSEAASCMSSNVSRCGFNAPPADWACVGGLKEGTDACYEMLDCATDTSGDCMVPFVASLSELIFPAAPDQPAPTGGPQASSEGDDGFPLVWVLVSCGVVIVAAVSVAVYFTVSRRTTTQFTNIEASHGQELFQQRNQQPMPAEQLVL